MAGCPVCRRNFSKGVDRCPDCQVGIVPDIKEMIAEISSESPNLSDVIDYDANQNNKKGKRETNDFVEVYRAENVAIAGLIKEILEDHEIICYVDNYFSHSLNMNFIFPDAGSGVKIMVSGDSVEKALEIIKVYFN